MKKELCIKFVIYINSAGYKTGKHRMQRLYVYGIKIASLLLLLLLLALQPTMGFNLLSDFLPFHPFLAQFPPSSYSHHLEVFFNFFKPSFPGSTSNSLPCWLPF